MSKFNYYDAAASTYAQARWMDVDTYFCSKGYQSSYQVAKVWAVTNTVEALLGFFTAKAYGLCWQVPEEAFDAVMNEFEVFCLEHYDPLQTELSSEATFKIWVYAAS
ncbi:MAG: hypothetical protein AAFY20_23135 [Cyanobacteria bacterium J06639_14]